AHCSFHIRASVLQSGTIRITIMNPHSCSPATHFDNTQASSVVYLLDYHRESVIANREITPKQIQISERLQHQNTISYTQAYRVRKALRFEIEGNEGRLFKCMPAIHEVALRNDPLNH